MAETIDADFLQNFNHIQHERHEHHVCSFSWSPNNEELLTICGDGSIWVWTPSYAECFQFIAGSGLCRAQSSQTIAWSPNSRRFSCSDRESEMVRVYEKQEPSGFYLSSSTPIVQSHNITCVAWAGDSMHLATGSVDGTMQVFWYISMI